MDHRRPRRVVTGTDERGRSRVVSDGPSPGRFALPDTRFDVIWHVNAQPPRVGDSVDSADLDRYSMQPARGVTTWVILEIPPAGTDSLDLGSPKVASARQRFDDAGVYETGSGGWHRTDTLDFAVVLEGEIDLELDDGIHRLGPGDCVVQTGVRHRWVNRGTSPCRISGIVIGATSRSRKRGSGEG